MAIQKRSLGLISATLLIVSATTMAQSFPVRWSTSTQVPGHTPLGITVIEDINADGHEDLAMVTARAGDFAGLGEYLVSFRCGRTGQFIHASTVETHAAFLNLPFIPIHTIDDLDGDGREDVVTFTIESVSPPAEFRTFSSATGAEIMTAFVPSPASFSMQADMSTTIPDRNGNGVREVAVITRTLNAAGTRDNALVVFDPLTGATLVPGDVQLGQTTDARTNKIFDVGDTNSDGIPDLLIDIPDGINTERLVLISGLDFSVLLDVSVPATSITGVIGDTDGDGEVECGINDGTSVAFFNIPSGTLSTTLPLPPSFIFLFPITRNLGDLNGDEIDDFSLVINLFTPTIRIYSGFSLERQRVAIDSVDPTLFLDLRALGDVDGDGPEEAVMLSQGVIRGISLAGALPYAPLLPANSLQLSWTESSTPGTTRGTIRVEGGQPLGAGLVAVSFASDLFVVNGTTILLDPDALAFDPATISYDAAGRFETALNLGIPALEGISLFTQAFDVTSSPVTSSNGLELYFTLP